MDFLFTKKLLGKEMNYPPKNINEISNRNEQHSLIRKASIVILYVVIFWIFLPAFLFFTGLRLDILLPIRLSNSFIYKYFGELFILTGFVVMLISMVQLKFQGKGLPISHLPPEIFVEKGMYKKFRHPIYIGYTLTFLGISILIQSFWSMSFCTILLILGWIGYALFYEEPELIKRFGTVYSDYKKRVPLLLSYKIIKQISRFILPIKFKLFNILSKIADNTILYKRGNLIFASYGLYFTIGAIIMMGLIIIILLNLNLKPMEFNVFITGAMLNVLIFSRLFWWFGNFRKFSSQKFGGLRNTGLVSWGGLTGQLINVLIFSKLYNYSFLLFTDVIFSTGFLAYAIGRVGCISYGCCYGLTTHNIGIMFNNPESKVVREKGLIKSFRYPTQLYSVFLGIFLFTITILITFLSPPPGFITAIVLMLYGILRTFIEFFRDRKRVFKNILSEGHIGCILTFLIGWLTVFFIIPNQNGFSPKIFSTEVIKEGIRSLPIILILGTFCFFFTATHWKKLGKW